MPPLLVGFGVLEARAERIARRRLEDQRRADAALVDLLLRRGVAGVEPAHESHLEEHAGLLDRAPASPRTSSSDSAGGFSQNVGLRAAAAAITSSRWVCVGLTIDDRVDAGIVDQRQRIGVVARHVELRGHLRRDASSTDRPPPTSRVSGMRPAEIARVHAAQPAEADQSNVEPHF